MPSIYHKTNTFRAAEWIMETVLMHNPVCGWWGLFIWTQGWQIPFEWCWKSCGGEHITIYIPFFFVFKYDYKQKKMYDSELLSGTVIFSDFTCFN